MQADNKGKEKVSEEEEERLWKEIKEVFQDEEEFKQFRKTCKDEEVFVSDLIGGNYEEKDLIDLGLLKKGLRKRLLNHLGRFFTKYAAYFNFTQY